MILDVANVQLHADRLGDRLKEVTDEAVGLAVDPLRVRVDRARTDLVALWVRMFGDTSAVPSSSADAARFSRAAQSIIAAALVPDGVDQDAATQAVMAAYALGTDHALETVPFLPPDWPLPGDLGGPDLADLIAEQAVKALTALNETTVEALGFPSVGVGMARMSAAVTRSESAIAWAVTRNCSDGVRDVAKAANANVVWVAERNGCLHCLAYAGRVTDPGTPFPDGLTFGDKPLHPPDLITGPGLHPHCRCTLQVLDRGNHEVPAALIREAKRSVLRGVAIQESDAARIRAAERLLIVGSGLPKTVQARAWSAVKRGTFT